MIRPLFAFTALLATVAAQDSYWVASRFSNELHQINSCGELLNVVPMTAAMRSAHAAPDGKIWVVRFIQSTLDIYDPATGTTTTATHPLGSAFSIAFDAQGTAWVTGGSGVENFDANGNSIQSYPLPAAAPLGITIDSAGNKWIAHRATAPGSISQIDPAGAITNYPLPATSTIQPVSLVADFRGITMGNHIWIVGDGSSDLVEFDPTTSTFNVFTLTSAAPGSIVADVNGDIWVGDFRSGDIIQLDSAGTVVNSYNTMPSVNGMAFDHFGKLWITSRVSFSGPAPSELRRVEAAFGSVEVVTPVGLGNGSSMSSLHHYAMVVDPFGDLDGDGDANIGEILAGNSPGDPCSTGIVSINTSGNTTTGNSASLDVNVGAGNFWAAALATGTVAPGSGFIVAGIACEVLLDPTTGLTGTLAGIGPSSVPLPIPNNPSLVGFVVYFQGLGTSGAGAQFSNAACVNIWN